MGQFEGLLRDYNNSGQTIASTDIFRLCKVLLPSSPPYPYGFDVTLFPELPKGIQIKERRKLSFTMVVPYTADVDNSTHVAVKWSAYFRDGAYYKVEDFKIINSAICEISVVFDAITTLLVNKPRLSGVVTATVNGDTPIIEPYEPTHLLKKRCCTFKGTGTMCMYITIKQTLDSHGNPSDGSGDIHEEKRGYVNATTEYLYRVPYDINPYFSFTEVIESLVLSSATRGGMFVQDIWFEELPPEGVDNVYGSLELNSSGISDISPVTLQRVSRYSKVVAKSSTELPYKQYDTINQPLTSLGVDILYGDSKTTLPYREILNYANRASYAPLGANFEVLYSPTTTSSSNSKLSVYIEDVSLVDAGNPLVEYDIQTTSIGPVSHPYATEFYTYEARNAVAISEEIIQTIVALTFNISSLIDSKKKDYTGVADSILSFFFTSAARIASVVDMKRLPIEGGGGSMTPINTLYVEYDVMPTNLTGSWGSHYTEFSHLALYERYRRPFSCTVKVADVSWDEGIFWDSDYDSVTIHGAYMSHVQGNFTISDTNNRYSAAELREMMDVLSDGILIYKNTLVTVEEEIK